MTNLNQKIWICGNRMPKYFNCNPLYECFDPDASVERENINKLNRFWSEYVCQYYVWKNNVRSNFISFCHDTRIIKVPFIDTDKINDGVGYYFIWKEPFSKEKDIIGNAITPADKVPHPEYRNFYYEIVDKIGMPLFMYNDFAEYLKKQKVVSQESLAKAGTEIPYILITREIYSCTWNTFTKMQEFLFGYFDMIQKKYFDYDFNKHKEFFQDVIRKHYVEMLDKAKESNAYISCSRWLYQQPGKLVAIKDASTDYGFDIRSNLYRLHSYIIEILVSIFIKSKDNFFIENAFYTREPQILSDLQ